MTACHLAAHPSGPRLTHGANDQAALAAFVGVIINDAALFDAVMAGQDAQLLDRIEAQLPDQHLSLPIHSCVDAVVSQIRGIIAQKQRHAGGDDSGGRWLVRAANPRQGAGSAGRCGQQVVRAVRPYVEANRGCS
jgi:hypothetical protein